MTNLGSILKSRDIILQEQEEPEPVEEPILSDDEHRTLRRERERNAVQLALNEALEAEDYERAAKLRDELKKLEDGPILDFEGSERR